MAIDRHFVQVLQIEEKKIKSNTQYNEKTLFSLQVYCLRYVKIK